jgi:hypothetical protein
MLLLFLNRLGRFELLLLRRLSVMLLLLLLGRCVRACVLLRSWALRDAAAV